jgi:hypothetical protein
MKERRKPNVYERKGKSQTYMIERKRNETYVHHMYKEETEENTS